MDDRLDDRFFTIASAPYKGYVQITTRFVSQPSTFKQALRRLPIGAEIQIDEPEGEFVINDPTQNYIFVAGGIGITPFRSILAEADHDRQMLRAHILYGNRDKQILFKNELDRLIQRNPKLSIDYLVGSEGITEKQLKQAIELMHDPYVYLSGPEPMVESLAVATKKLGLNISHIVKDPIFRTPCLRLVAA